MWLLLPLMNGGPDEPTTPEDEVAWADPLAPRDDGVDERPLTGHLVPSLVVIEDPSLTLRADGLMSPREHYEGPATIVIGGMLSHPFDGEIRDVDFRASFIDFDGLDHVWRRLMAPPLELTQEELERRFPLPEFTLELRIAQDLEPDQPIDIAVPRDYANLELDPRDLPAYVGGVVSYRLTQPSSDDIRRIVEAGGIADLEALSEWLAEVETQGPPFVAAERRMLVRVAAARLRALRAPPGHGDFRRVHGLLELVRQLASPADLEMLLALDQPMRILLMSEALSYQGALVEESTLELPVHGLRELPSSSRMLGAYRNALEGIRIDSLPQLLRLAYDPIDYAQSPHDDFVPSEVQAEARSLLEPLSPTRVASILGSADGDIEAQRKILDFYVEIRFGAAVEPMMRWLLLHPDQVDSHGRAWAKSLGKPVVPTLLRYYIDPIGPGERELARKMLLALDDQAAKEAVASLRAAGIPVPADADMQATIASFESREGEVTARQAATLVAELFEGDNDVLSMSARLRAAERLAHIAPELLYERDEACISLLAELVLTLDTDSPVESERALELLETIEFPDRTRADDEVAMVKARLAFAHGDYRAGLDTLLERRPQLDEARLRELYGDGLQHWIELSIDGKSFGLAEELLEEAEHNVADRARTWEALGRTLFIARYWPALILGALFGLTTLTTAAWLAVRGLQALVGLVQDAHARGDRRRRREAHLLRAEAELVRLAASDGTLIDHADALLSPFDEDAVALDRGDDAADDPHGLRDPGDDPPLDDTIEPLDTARLEAIAVSPPPGDTVPPAPEDVAGDLDEARDEGVKADADAEVDVVEHDDEILDAPDFPDLDRELLDTPIEPDEEPFAGEMAFPDFPELSDLDRSA